MYVELSDYAACAELSCDAYGDRGERASFLASSPIGALPRARWRRLDAAADLLGREA